VIGDHGQSPFPIPVGSTSANVVRNAPCPVLVVRGKQSRSARSQKRGAL
jgi:nucleotide-binding universal stress UspA family protein